jgi:phage baseplate assembly protein gpV
LSLRTILSMLCPEGRESDRKIMAAQKKTRAQLKSYFAENSIPTADDFAAIIDGGLNVLDDQFDPAAGKLTVTDMGMTLGAAVDGGRRTLTVHGSIQANQGITIPNGQLLSVEQIALPAGSTTLTVRANAVIIEAAISANGLTLPNGNLTVSNGSATIDGSLSAKGMTLPSGNLTVSNGSATVEGTLSAKGVTLPSGDLVVATGSAKIGTTNSHTLTVAGKINARGGLEVPAGQTLQVIEPIVGRLSQNNWTASSLADGWTNATNARVAGYFKDPFDVVHVRGTIKAGESATKVLLTLPLEHRPAASESFLVWSTAPGAGSATSRRVTISADGTITLDGDSPSNNEMVSLGGITFVADG